MSSIRPPMDDITLDRLVASMLRQEAEVLARRQPTLEEAIGPLSARLGSRPSARRPAAPWRGRPRPAVSIAWIALLLTAVAVAGFIGAQLLSEDRSPIVQASPGPQASGGPEASGRPVVQARPFGLGLPCAVAIEQDTLVQVEWDAGSGDAGTTTYHRSGLVTRTLNGTGMGFPDPDRRREIAVSGTSVSTLTLTAEGLDLVKDRIEQDLAVEPGCYRLRTFESGGLLTVRTPGGAVELLWSQSAGDFSVARLMPVDETERLRFLADALANPEIWLPEDAYEMAEGRPFGHPERWIVHVVLLPTEYSPDAVLGLGSGPPVSATDGRYAAVALPQGADLATFGEPLGASGTDQPASTQRCGMLPHDAALRLATSLDDVAIGVEGEADLYTPDMARAVFVSLIPAPGTYDCAAYGADLRAADAGPAPVVTPEVTGDLAHVDPCSLVPPAIRGRVDASGYGLSEVALGVPARRCVLVNVESYGVARERVQLWLHPWTLALDEAELVVSAMFGDGITSATIAGHPVWLNHCLSGRSCVGALAAWADGRLLVLEVTDLGATPGQRTERALADMATILGAPG